MAKMGVLALMHRNYRRKLFLFHTKHFNQIMRPTVINPISISELKLDL